MAPSTRKNSWCFFFSLHFWMWKGDQVDSHPLWGWHWARLPIDRQRFAELRHQRGGDSHRWTPEQLGMLWMFLAQVDSFGFWLQFAANSSSRSHKLRTESCRSNRQIELGLVLLQSICSSFCSFFVEFLGTLEMHIWSTVSLADQRWLWLTKYIGVMPSKMIPLMVQKSQNNHLGCVKPCK